MPIAVITFGFFNLFFINILFNLLFDQKSSKIKSQFFFNCFFKFFAGSQPIVLIFLFL